MEIEEIRGVGCDYAINILLEHNLIEIVGRKETVGHPALFGTTDEFLKRFDISSIDELPDYNQMLLDIQKINEKKADDSLYNNFKIEGETEKQVDQKLNELAKEAKQQAKEKEAGENPEDYMDEFVDANLDSDDML